jgi:calcineurin-like phosphoesterase family protein
MSEVYVIADLHFGHRKLAELRGFTSADEHDQALIKAWNSKVTTKDVTYVLGDVFRLDRVNELRGIKHLALGNHDQKAISTYAGYFNKVRSCFEFDNCLLTHIPVHPNQFPRFELNIHGHMHAGAIEDDRYFCVSVERCAGMMPISLRSLLQHIRQSRMVK